MAEGHIRGRAAGELHGARRFPAAGELSYGERALELDECAGRVVPVEWFVNSTNIHPDLTVLDLWCASRLAIPLAQRVRHVTAVDFSKDACHYLGLRCRKEGIRNIAPWFCRLGDDLPLMGMGTHDVVIASWPILVHNVPASTIMLNRLARKSVYLCVSVGNGPFDRPMFEAVGRSFATGPSYTSIYYDLVHRHLGLMPNLLFLRENLSGPWESPEDALDAQRWMFPGMTEWEEQEIRMYLANFLVNDGALWRLSYARECTWAIMWWDKD